MSNRLVAPGVAPLSAALDFVRVLGSLPGVELRRREASLHSAVAGARQKGARRIARSAADRARLRVIISRLDRYFPGGGNCVRRALLEMALDSGAARERVFAGFKTGGGVGSGHAWLESDAPANRYDAVISI